MHGFFSIGSDSCLTSVTDHDIAYIGVFIILRLLQYMWML